MAACCSTCTALGTRYPASHAARRSRRNPLNFASTAPPPPPLHPGMRASSNQPFHVLASSRPRPTAPDTRESSSTGCPPMQSFLCSCLKNRLFGTKARVTEKKKSLKNVPCEISGDPKRPSSWVFHLLSAKLLLIMSQGGVVYTPMSRSRCCFADADDHHKFEP